MEIDCLQACIEVYRKAGKDHPTSYGIGRSHQSLQDEYNAVVTELREWQTMMFWDDARCCASGVLMCTNQTTWCKCKFHGKRIVLSWDANPTEKINQEDVSSIIAGPMINILQALARESMSESQFSDAQLNQLTTLKDCGWVYYDEPKNTWVITDDGRARLESPDDAGAVSLIKDMYTRNVLTPSELLAIAEWCLREARA